MKSPVKKKRKRSITNKKAEICVVDCRNVNEPLTCFSSKSWETVHNAAVVRNDDHLITIYTNKNEKYGYHRTCYQSYTNPKNLKRCQQNSKELLDSQSQVSNHIRPNLTTTSETNTSCIFCNKRKTSQNGTGYETLLQCTSESSLEMISSIIGEKSTKEIKNAWYHRSCYRIRSKPSQALNDCQDETDLTREESFESLKAHVTKTIIEDGKVVKINDLRAFYEDDQKSRNLEVKGATNRLVKLRLQRTFGEKLTFFKKTGTSCVVVFNSVALTMNVEAKSKEEKVKEVAQFIREEIEKMPAQFSQWPPPAEELKHEKVIIPPFLEMLLTSLLTTKKPSDRTVRLVKSLGQDIIYNFSSGRTKTVKHCQVGLFTKRKTGSKQIINCLNKLGHSTSYCEVNRLETAFAERENNNKSMANYLPSKVVPGLFGTFVYDNGDHNPETINGESMHCTNGILIQKPAAKQQPVVQKPAFQSYSNKRSFSGIRSDLEPYYSVARSSPKPISNIAFRNFTTDQTLSKKEDFLWIIARHQASQLQKPLLPGWTGFHNLTKPDNKEPHSVHYLPSIDKPPTEMSTIQEILKQIKMKSEAIGLESADAVFDHAIYAKALEVILDPKNSEMNKFINLRMGGFHASLVFIAVICKRFYDAGLKDVFVETNLVGSEMTNSVLRGKKYNKAVRALKIVHEALQRLKFEAFENWLEEKKESARLTEVFNSIDFSMFLETQNKETMKSATIKAEKLFQSFQLFEASINQGDLGPMAQFWQSFIEMTQTLLDYLKSMRTGDWDLHLSSSETMLKWFHAYDHTNYARHFTYCWSSQQNLSQTHPEILKEFKEGNFVCKRTAGSFNMLPPDQVIEQTINKDQKGPGGIIGFSTSENTVQRWILTSHIAAEISADLKESLDIETTSSKPKDLNETMRSRDEEDILKCIDMISARNNPFVKSSKLIGLSSGVVASDDITKDLLTAADVGEKQLKRFIADRIQSSKIKFHDVIKRNNLKTFSSIFKTTQHKVNDQIITIKADRNTFSRLVVIQSSRSIDLRVVLNFELCSVPLSLSEPNGTLVKNNKANLFNSLIADIPIVSSVPSEHSVIFDGMVLLQKLPKTLKTFGEVSDYLLKKVLSGTSKQVYFVTDQYLQNSIKSMERTKRSSIGTIRVTAQRRDQKKPKQFKQYLRSAENKIELIKFLVNDWTSNKLAIILLKNKKLFVTIEDRAYSINLTSAKKIETKAVPELSSQHEEADTKIFLCAGHATRCGFQNIKIVTVDSDVAVLSVYYQNLLQSSLYLEIGTSTKTKLFDLKRNTIDKKLREILPALHAISGCDSTSAFSGIGKVKCKTVMMSNERFTEAARSIGNSYEIPELVINTLEEYTCKLYGTDHTDINEARYHLFTKSKTIPDPNRLPPTRDALRQHLKRANYQAREWKLAMDRLYQWESPVGHGWLDTGGVLSVNWMESKPAPDAVLEFASCKCKKIKCSNKQCKCKSLGLPCTDLCECVNCENEPIISEEQKEDEVVGDDEGMNDDLIDFDVDVDDVLDQGDEEFFL